MCPRAYAAGKRPQALTMGAALARGALDPVAVAEAALARAEASRGVFVSLSRERARLEAEAAAARLAAGLARSPLDGVPVAWKDLVDVQGSVTTVGSRVLARRPPARRDAPVVARASGAGLVAIGKTNLSELAYSGLGLNPHYGTPANPASAALDESAPGAADAARASPPRVPGGSSSGSAVAVAAGIVPLAVGSDTAGSLRVPAAFNGLVAYRPSRARHDLAGVAPLASSLDTIGPLATSVADCVALDDCMREGVVRARRPATPRALRIVVDETSLEDERVEASVRENLERALDRLGAADVRLDRRPVAAVAEVLRLVEDVGWLGAPEALAEYGWLLDTPDAPLVDARVRRRLAAATRMSADRLVHLQRARDRLASEIRDDLEGALLLMPTVAHVAPEIAPLERDDDLFARVNRDTLRLTMVASFLDLPTVALPSGTDADGQHTGLSVSAPTGDDERLLRAALAASRLLDIEAPPPEREAPDDPEGRGEADGEEGHPVRIRH